MLNIRETYWTRYCLTWGLAYLLVGFVVATVLLGPLIGAKLALPDENDIPTFMGRDGITIADVPRVVVEKTEVGEYGQGQRMRPVYFVDRVVETALWGYDASKWYALRICMFGLIVAVLLWVYVRFAGLALGAGLTILTLSYPMWTDIWARSTGPSEQIAMLGTAIFAIGATQFVERWKDGHSLRTACVLAGVGALIAMGSKENMLFLMLPLAGAIAAMVARKRTDAPGIAALLIAIGMGCWVASSILVYFSANKVQDIYGSSPTVALVTSRWRGLAALAFGAIAYLFATWWVDREIARRRGHAAQAEYRRIAVWFFAGVLAIVVLFVAQFLFYSGRLPSQGRYDFPALLAVPALIILCTWAWGRTAELLFDWKDATNAFRITASALAIIYALVFPSKLPAAVANRVTQTNIFETGVLQSKEMASKHPDWPIIVRSYDPWDYEVVQTIGVVFLARQIKNPLYMVHKPLASKPQTEFEASSLSGVLIEQSRNGFAPRGYRPIGELKDPKTSQCFAVILASAEAFQSDRNRAQPPVEGLNCLPLPLSLYWSKGKLIFQLFPVR
jgi:hypothetical protein